MSEDSLITHSLKPKQLTGVLSNDSIKSFGKVEVNNHFPLSSPTPIILSKSAIGNVSFPCAKSTHHPLHMPSTVLPKNLLHDFLRHQSDVSCHAIPCVDLLAIFVLGKTFVFLQSLRTSLSFHDISKVIHKDLSRTSASSQHFECYPSAPMDLNESSSLKQPLAQPSSIAANSPWTLPLHRPWRPRRPCQQRLKERMQW